MTALLPSLRIFLPPPTTTFNAQNGTFFLGLFQVFVARANKEAGHIHNRTSRMALAPLVFVLVRVCNRLCLHQSDQPIQLALPYGSIVGYHIGKRFVNYKSANFIVCSGKMRLCMVSYIKCGWGERNHGRLCHSLL